MVSALTASRSVYLGLFLVTLATMMYEIALTRIFSVTMWYHLAFVAISVAMFGMTVGALVVYLAPGWFPPAGVGRQLGLSALLFGVGIVGSLLTHLAVPFTFELSLRGLGTVVFTYVVVAVPFVFGGIAVTLALTRFPAQVARLYAADLVGAAAGCVLVIVALDITDGPTTVIATAAIACAAAACFLADAGPGLRATALLGVIGLSGFVAVNSLRILEQASLLRVTWVKGAREARPLFEKWNSFSRVTVSGDPRQATPPQGWGMSATYPAGRGVHQLWLLMDAAAGSVLTRFDGGLEGIEHLKYDVTNLPHWLRRDARVLAVGVGGGRDVLSALAFRQRSVVGVEINETILDVVNAHFGDFTGHLDRDARVRFVNDEARSYIARQAERFDILQISLIDTWAATGAGAFVLSEHSLYTTEAWALFLDRLTPRGVLSVSRWYYDPRPDEMYRVTSLAVTALAGRGVTRPAEHLIVVRHATGAADGRIAPLGVATLLVSPSPFSPADVDAAEELARRLRFEVVLSPRGAATATFAALAGGRNLPAVYAASPTNIAPPTDDSPFFFHMLRPRDLLGLETWRAALRGSLADVQAVGVLGVLLLTVVGLTVLCIVVPLALTSDRGLLAGAAPLFVFFAGIGFGFMLVEISQMQRLIIFLGHPTYGLSVVLFAMLASSGAGSLVAGRAGGRPAAPLLALVAALAIFGTATPPAIRAFEAATTPARIAVAIGLLLPIGFLMGMAFPLGMRLAARRAAALSPWLWGINGATSVCASVVAVVIALHWGIAASFWTGVGCYVAAAAALALETRRARATPVDEGRHGLAGAARAVGGLGAMSGPPVNQAARPPSSVSDVMM
jgi:hypothetical protein